MMSETPEAEEPFVGQEPLEDQDSSLADGSEPGDEEPHEEGEQVEADQVPEGDTQLLADLTSPDEAVKAGAIESLKGAEASSPEILSALEGVAAHDPSRVLREAALEALNAPVHRGLRMRSSHLPPYRREMVQAEIDTWEDDGLISSLQAAVLRSRYPVYKKIVAEKKEKPKDETPRSLREILLGETAVKIALYLGAFFVIMAAFIFAVAIEELRVPILAVVAMVAFISALALVKRLPQASFVFFTIGSFLVPITAGVLIDQVEVLSDYSEPYWMSVWGFMALIWIGGTALYRSRLFSILALWSASLAALFMAVWLGDSGHLIPLLVAVPTLLSLGCVYLLRRWEGERLSRPLFVLAQVQQLILMASSAIAVGVSPPAGDLGERAWWLVIALTWLLGSGFFTVSQSLVEFQFFPLMSVAALVPVPLFALGVFDPSERAMAIVAWIWGLLIALSGQGLSLVKQDRLRLYSPFLVFAGAGVFTYAAVLGLSELVGLGVGMLVGITLLYLGLTLWQQKTFTWIATVTAALWAYLAVFQLKAVKALEIGYEYVLLFPALVYMSAELVARVRFNVSQRWYWPVRVLGLLAVVASGLFALDSGVEQPWIVVILCSVYAVFWLIYALYDGRTLIGVAVTASLAFSIPFWVHALNWDHWLVLVFGLAAFYWVGGLLLNTLPKTVDWSNLLRVSGLVLGTVGAMTAPVEGGALAVLGTAFIASFFVVEAVRLRNIWLGYPANLLYLGAYFIALIELEVTEPQFFSIGAALLGIVMHYLLVRGRHYLAAGITGVIAQLILLSTTYFQLVSSEKFSFFFIIFLQSLILLVYGVIVRARSFVITPIIFAVLSVITVAFSVLSGVWTILLIGCTGALLLALGVLALLMRERISKATSELGERMSDWRG
jgi:hypothetical protein